MRSNHYRSIYVLTALLCLLSLSFRTRSAHAADAVDTLPAPQLVRLGAGDSVNIQVYGQPDMNSTVYVGDDGTISVPLVGSVPVGNLTPVEAAGRVEKALKDRGYLVDPHVTINVVQSKSQRISVLGEVRQPGRYAIDPNTSVFDLLAQAGGLTENSADVGYVSRSNDDGKTTRFPVDLRGSSAQHETDAVRLQGGDELYVPRAAQFYIYGEVNTPGMYRIEPGMTIIQAVARAGGVTVRGSARRIEVKRVTANGVTKIIHIGPNDPVQPDDVIRVKQSIF